MSDTPRTDFECRKPENAGRVNGVLPADFARQLERELNASDLRVRNLRHALESLADQHYTHPRNWPEYLRLLIGTD